MNAKTKMFLFPLLGKVFYLDVTPQEAEAIDQQIKDLGGRIEPTYNPRKVTHVVTSRELPPKEDKSRMAQLLATPPAPTHKSSFRGADVLQVAQKAGKGIYCLKKMKPFLTARCQEVQQHSFGGSPGGPVTGTMEDRSPSSPNPPRRRNLTQSQERRAANSPYPLNRTYSPNQLMAQPVTSPAMHPAVVIADAITPQQMEDMRRAGMQVPAPVVKEFPPDSMGRSTVPTLHEDFVCKYSPFLSPAEQDKVRAYLQRQATAPQKPPGQSTTQAKPGPKAGWCECCGVSFQDHDKHVVSPSHVAYGRNDANFAMLDNYLMQQNGELWGISRKL